MKQYTVLALISVVGGILVFGPAGLILEPVAVTATTVLLKIWPQAMQIPEVQVPDQEAISRFENEGGPPAA